MSHMSQLERRKAKRDAILESARIVFCRKGLIDATMKDIIEECGISRGGIYLYYDSVDDIFIDVLKDRIAHKFEGIREMIHNNEAFDEVFEAYLVEYKNRLLFQMDSSMSRAMYEYFFTHKSDEDRVTQKQVLENVRVTLLAMLELGVQQKVLFDKGIEDLAENFMFLFEGLNVLALLGGLEESHVDRQFAIVRELLPRV